MALKHGVTSNTSSRVTLGPGVVYANWENGTGTLLGATVGGGSININRSKYSVRPDGAKGKVKGLEFIQEVAATFQLNMLESTKDNLIKFGLALNESAYASAEAVGTGDGSTTVFELDNTADGTIAKVFVAGSEQTSGVTVSGTSVTFTTAPASGSAITADYTYSGTAASGDYYRLTGDTSIASGDYLTNIAILLEYTGDSVDPVVLIIDNPTATGDFALSLPTGQEEIVYPVTWEAHFDPSTLTTEPWAIYQPE